MTPDCPTEAKLLRMLDGLLPVDEQEACERHVETCPDCQRVLERLTSCGELVPPGLPGERDVGRSGAEPPPLQARRPVGAGPAGAPEIPGYAILDELGRGGMGVVYRAKDLTLNRLVALKMILAGHQATPEQLVRFRGEGEAVARLRHPNIVQIHELGSRGGQPFCVLEYIEGGTLEEHLAGRPMPPRDAAELAETLARAIHHAHAQGIVHRDLKPANVLMAPAGAESPPAPDRPAGRIPKITDFGLARPLDAAWNLTRSGVMAGTPSYMAPEQARPDRLPIGPWTDVHALGAVLYELLTGRPPFLSASSQETLEKVVHEDPVPPSRLQPTLPRDLTTICLKCLEKDPDRRYRSADALADDLRRYLDGRPIRARRTGAAERLLKWARRNSAVASMAAVAALLLMTLAVGSSVAALRINRERLRADAKARGERIARATAERALARSERAAEESLRRLVRLYVNTGSSAFERAEYDSALLWFHRAWEADRPDSGLEISHRTRIASTLDRLPRLEGLCVQDAPILFATLSPEGRRLLTRTDGPAAFLWDPFQGRPAADPLRHGGRVLHAGFSPDGRLVATCGEDRTARLWDAETGAPVGRAMPHPYTVHWAAFSPDGRSLATACADGRIRFWDVADRSEQDRRVDCAAPALFVAFHPDGDRVLTADAGEMARLWDAESGTPILPPIPHRMDPGNPFDRLELPPAFSQDGRSILAASGRTVHLQAVEGPRRISRDVGFAINRAELDPEGNRILAVGRSTSALVLDATSKDLAVLHRLPHPREVQQGCFRPGSGEIVTASSSGVLHAWDSAGNPRPIPMPRAFDNCTGRLEFSPDGRLLLAPSLDGGARLWRIDGRSSRPRPLHLRGPDSDRLQPMPIGRTTRMASSPDGRRAVVVEDFGPARVIDLGRSDAVVAVLDLGGPTLLARFSGDGRLVMTVGPGRARLWRADSGEPFGPPIEPEHPMKFLESADRLDPGVARYAQSVQLSRDGARMAILDAEDEVLVFDTRNGSMLLGPIAASSVSLTATDAPGRSENSPDSRRIQGHSFSADGRRLAVGINLGRGAAVLLFDVDSGRSIRLALPNGYLRCLSFSDDSRRLLTGSTDRAVRVYDAETGRPLGPPLRHRTFVHQAAFGPDGRRVVAYVADETLCVWDCETGDLLIPPFPTGIDRLSWIWFGRDGLRIIGQSPEGSGHEWPLPRFRLPRGPAGDLVQLLSASEIDGSGGIARLPRSTLRDDPDRYLQAWIEWRDSDEY